MAPSNRSASSARAHALQLAEPKLAASDLTLDDAKALGIEVLIGEQTAAHFSKIEVPALKLPYFDVHGRLRPDVYRLRVLEAPKGPLGSVRKDVRYLQPAGSPPAAYFPKTTDWGAVVGDPLRQVLVTEGELKAACASKHEHACIGLGGVWSWRSKARGWPLLPELEENVFVWAKRDVVLVFDSDAATNPDVILAQQNLGLELTLRGAKVRVAQLPEVVEP